MGQMFTQLIGSLVHGLFRGFNVHEIEWKNDGNMVYPACFHQLPAQYMRWEDRAGHPDKLLFIADGETAEAKPFPAYKYIVGLNTSGPDHPIYNATYYSLVAWFGAFKFGLGWFMEYCQKYGIPKLVFHYESPNDRKQLEKDLSEERVLNNILLKGDRTVDIANAPASGASLPQRELLNLAESACHKLILGQTLTSDTSEHGGSLAQAKVHAGVQADIVKKRADFVADVLNTQLIPAIVLLNYGKLDVPMPELRFKIPQEGVTLERVQVVKTALEIKGMKLKKSEVYEFTGFAQPAEGDDVFEAASEGADMAGLAGLMGKGKPQDDTDPDDDPNKPKKKASKSESEDAEPVSAAKTDAPTDPAQEWLAPIKQKFLEARKAGASMADMRKILLTMHPDTQALAKAFANNILAGFAGESEEVDAANPYGCNQYGEGWRMPHNGRASKVGAPVKKTDPTEEERKQREEEERKRQEEQQRKEEEERKARDEAERKEKEDSELLPEKTQKELLSIMGKEKLEQFKEQLRNMPEEAKRIWKKYIGEVSFRLGTGQVSSTSTDGRFINIVPSSLVKLNYDGTNWGEDNSVIFHEFGHAVDLLHRKQTAKSPLDLFTSVDRLQNAVSEDVKSQLKETKSAMIQEAKEVLARHGGKVTKEFVEELTKRGELGSYMIPHIERDGFSPKFLPAKYQIALGYKQNGRTPVIKKYHVAVRLSLELNKNGNERACATVGDAYKGNGIETDYGHSKAYYKNWKGQAESFETFANMFAAYASNDKKGIEGAKKYLPKTYDQFTMLLEEL